jgi:predicted amidohydrolase YtcJ
VVLPRTGAEPICLLDAQVVTADAARPRAQALAMRDGRIIAVGSNADVRDAAGGHARIFDCGGRTVAPGFVDPHVHLLALARSASSVDLSPSRVDTMAKLGRALGAAAGRVPPGCWVRGYGYDEFYLHERRHPTRYDLDRAVPGRPVRIRHRSRHASVLNSSALRIVAARVPGLLDAEGVERDRTSGEPTGVMYELDAALRAVIPRVGVEELRIALRQASMRLLAAGVTTVDDASASTGPEEWALLCGAVADGAIWQRLRALWGVQRYGLPADAAVTAVKLMLDEDGGHDGGFHELLEAAHRQGMQVAVHAVEGPAIAVAVAAFRDVLARWPRLHRHRIEHCALCPTPLAEQIAALDLVVVAQPGFLAHVGDRYVAEVPASEQRWLYPLRTLLACGVRVAGSSDAPVGPLSPLVGIDAAVNRRSRRGTPVVVEESLSLDAALRLYTTGGAYAAGLDAVCGRLAPGYAADVVLLDRDVTRTRVEHLSETSVVGLFVRGRYVSMGDLDANRIDGAAHGG